MEGLKAAAVEESTRTQSIGEVPDELPQDLFRKFRAIETNDIVALHNMKRQPHLSILFTLCVIRLLLHPLHRSLPSLQDLEWRKLRRMLADSCAFLNALETYPFLTGPSPIIYQMILPFLMDRRMQLQHIRNVSLLGYRLCSWVWYVIYFEREARRSPSFAYRETKAPVASTTKERNAPENDRVCPLVNKDLIVYASVPQFQRNRQVIRLVLRIRGTLCCVRYALERQGIYITAYDHIPNIVYRLGIAENDRALPIHVSVLRKLESSTQRSMLAQMTFFWVNGSVPRGLERKIIPTFDGPSVPFTLRMIVMDRRGLKAIGTWTIDATFTLAHLRQYIDENGYASLSNSAYRFIYRDCLVSLHREQLIRGLHCLPLLFVLQMELFEEIRANNFLQVFRSIQTQLAWIPYPMPHLHTPVPRLNYFDDFRVQKQKPREGMEIEYPSDDRDQRFDVVQSVGLLFEDWTSIASFARFGNCQTVSSLSSSLRYPKRERCQRQIAELLFPTPEGLKLYHRTKPSSYKKKPASKRRKLIPFQMVAELIEEDNNMKKHQAKGKPKPPVLVSSVLPLYILGTFITTRELYVEGCTHEQLKLNLIEKSVIRFQDSSQIAVESIAPPATENDAAASAGTIRLAAPYKGALKRTSIWKVVSEKDDPRPLWLRELQFLIRHPTYDFAAENNRYINFRIPLTYHQVERWLEGRHWSKGVAWRSFATDLPVEDLLMKKFAQICRLHPPSENIDGVKFSLFARDANLVSSDFAMSSIDLLFAAYRDPVLLSLTWGGFIHALKDIANQFYPKLKHDPAENAALIKLFLTKIILAPSTKEIWYEQIDDWRLRTKILLMEKEAIKLSAAIRIQTLRRKYQHERRYKEYRAYFFRRWKAARSIQAGYRMQREVIHYHGIRKRLIFVQSCVRRFNQMHRYRQLVYERIFYFATFLQRWGKRYTVRWRNWREENRQILEHRNKLHLKRMRLLYSSILPLDHVLHRVRVYRSHICAPKYRQFDIEVYNPVTSTLSCITTNEAVLKVLLRIDLDKIVPPQGIVRDKKDFAKLVQRLHFEVTSYDNFDRNGELSRELILCEKRKYRTDKWLHSKVYRSPVGLLRIITFFIRHLCLHIRIHEPIICKSRELVLDPPRLFQIYAAFVENDFVTDRDERMKLSFLSRNTHLWHALMFKTEHREKFFDAIVKAIQLEDPVAVAKQTFLDRKNKVIAIKQRRQEEKECIMAKRIQRFIRVVRCRRLLKEAVRSIYVKQFDRTYGQYVYVHRLTGEYSWTRPTFLANEDDIEDPPDEWQTCYDTEGNIYYYNPAYGTTSWINDVQAAGVIQKWFRNMRNGDIGRFTIPLLVKALSLHNSARERYMEKPSNTRRLIRYTLYLHIIEHQYQEAHSLYEKALEMNVTTPLLLGCFAVLLIASCRSPRTKCWDRAHQILQKIQDDLNKQSAWKDVEDGYFVWAVLTDPGNGDALNNLAVYNQVIRRDYDKAERLYRRALCLNSAHKHLNQNYAQFMKERLPGGIYSSKGPGRIVLKRSMLQEPCGNFWFQMYDPETPNKDAAYFYWNQLSHKQQWTYPSPDQLIPTEDDEGAATTTIVG